jgi:hypothetical protein
MINQSISGSALSGLQNGLQEFRRVADKIATGVNKSGQPLATTDYTRSVVEMKQHEQQSKASVKVLEAYNDSLGSLLDERA